MALDSNVLKNGFIQLSLVPAVNVFDAASHWSQIYAQYAASAQSPAGGSAPSLSAAQGLLAQTLVGAFSGSDPNYTSQALTAAFTAFWMLPPVVFSDAGVVTAATGAAILPSALMAAWAVNLATNADAGQASGRIAGVLDAFTRLVIVTAPGPIVGPLT